jgi:hypothetical protein
MLSSHLRLCLVGTSLHIIRHLTSENVQLNAKPFQRLFVTNVYLYTVRSENRCALGLWYVYLVVSIEVAVDITSNTFYKCTANFRTQVCKKCLRIKLN